ncbi:MAG: YceI family protein [Spirochaetota bacterium]
MKKSLSVICCYFLLFSITTAQNIPEKKLSVKKGLVTFLSKTSTFSFFGRGRKVKGTVDLTSKKFSFQFTLQSLTTGIKLRDEHMHENYLESHTYPLATYEGTIVSFDEVTKTVTSKGKFYIHGIHKDNFTIESEFKKSKRSGYVLSSKFDLDLNDFNIKVPETLIFKLSRVLKIDIRMILVGGS